MSVAHSISGSSRGIAEASHLRMAATCGLGVFPALAWWLTRDQPAWLAMWAIAGSEFVALKIITLASVRAPVGAAGRALAYVMLWPGMDATAFLAARSERVVGPRASELGFGLFKLAGGLGACAWAVGWVGTVPPMLVGWVGMIGIIFTLHFGLLHVVSWLWRRGGVNAPPIMHAPIAAESLGDFWGDRWNRAFADAARRLLFRPTVRRLGVNGAGALVFLVSGLIHESVVSLPARGGWGGPTIYFLLQGLGLGVEKSALGRTLGLGAGWRGWLWTLLCTAGPLPLLFHAPFVHRVIVPFFATVNRILLP